MQYNIPHLKYIRALSYSSNSNPKLQSRKITKVNYCCNAIASNLMQYNILHLKYIRALLYSSNSNPKHLQERLYDMIIYAYIKHYFFVEVKLQYESSLPSWNSRIWLGSHIHDFSPPLPHSQRSFWGLGNWSDVQAVRGRLALHTFSALTSGTRHTNTTTNLRSNPDMFVEPI